MSGMGEPDQIDMMDEHELRVELRGALVDLAHMAEDATTLQYKLQACELQRDEWKKYADAGLSSYAELQAEVASYSSRLDSIRKACGAAVTNPVGAGLYASGYRDSAARVLNMMDDQNG